MKYLVLALGTLAAICHPPEIAAAERWVAVTQTDKVSVYTDTQSLTVKDGIVHVWEKWEYVADRPGIAATGHRPYRSVRFFTYYNCVERASAEMQSVYYDASGEVVGKVTEDPRYAPLTYVVPGLVSESTLNFVCKPRAPKTKKRS